MDTVGQNNLKHVLAGDCNDPDCEIHNPAVIEDESERLTACAWFLAGAAKAAYQAAEHFDTEITGDKDSMWEFLGAERE